MVIEKGVDEMKANTFEKEELRKSMGFSPKVPNKEIEGRINRCRKQLEKIGADAIVIYGSPYEPDLVRYLVNFVHPIMQSESLLLLPVRSDPVLLLDRTWFVDHAKKMSFCKDVRAFHGFIGSPNQQTELSRELMAMLKGARVEKGKILFLEKSLPVKFFKAIQQVAPKAILEDASSFVTEFFQNIGPYDREMIRRTAQIADEAMKAALDRCKEGTKEYEVGLAAKSVMVERGGEFGPTNAQPHCFIASGYTGPTSARPYFYTAKKLKRGDLFYVDLCAYYQGYYTDMCRSVVIGEPSRKQVKIFDTVFKIHQAMLNALTPGVTGEKVWKAGHDVAETAGYATYTEKRTYQGHGTGIPISIPPCFLKGEERGVKLGCFYNIEPGIFLPGQQAAIEDMVLIGEKGSELITKCKRELHVA